MTGHGAATPDMMSAKSPVSFAFPAEEHSSTPTAEPSSQAKNTMSLNIANGVGKVSAREEFVGLMSTIFNGN